MRKRNIGLLIVVVGLAGCACTGARPPAAVPVVVEVPALRVEPIPADWLEAHPVATGPLADCPDVAKARREELQECNRDKAKLRQRSGIE